MEEEITDLREKEKAQESSTATAGSNTWAWGLALIALGVIFLLNNLFEFGLGGHW
ncbi:MAG: hypothetical protein L0322_32530 [Chloroflexi bacterium]|nr:hypothetical protein [Chloroflexota bacterium]MCI0644910.1 hypothetical protein [Chloroflexota bacterium]